MPLLSHYTSRTGLEGIARNKSIWATKFSELNDKKEIEYGYIEFVRRALLETFGKLDELMPRKPGAKLDLTAAEFKLTEQFRNSFDSVNGSELLYVASFAKGKTADHDKRGLLTLWDRYTKLEGYCIQFDESDVRRVLELEAFRRNYALLTLNDVHYGIDEKSDEYHALLFQMTQHLLEEVSRGLPHLDIETQHDKIWAFNTFATRMLNYVAKHKDPFFEDEREARIIAVPAKQADSRIFTGLALRKPVQTATDGRSYVGIGEDWRPGLEPRRIIVGPKGSRNLDDILKLFEWLPEVHIADFPIR